MASPARGGSPDRLKGNVLARLLAFVVRDLRIARSYKLGFGLALGAGFVTLAALYFLGRTVGDAHIFSARFGTRADYFSYALVGTAVVASMRSLQTSFAHRLREAQVDGALEILFSAPLSTLEVVFGLALFPIGVAFVGGILLLIAGALFGAHLQPNFLGLAVTVSLCVLTFVPVGLISASFTLVFKRGDPFTYALDSAGYLLSGVIYPVAVLPSALQTCAAFLPQTHAITALRGALLEGSGVWALRQELFALGLFAVVLWPLGIWLLTLARRHVERTGTLPQA